MSGVPKMWCYGWLICMVHPKISKMFFVLISKFLFASPMYSFSHCLQLILTHAKVNFQVSILYFLHCHFKSPCIVIIIQNVYTSACFLLEIQHVISNLVNSLVQRHLNHHQLGILFLAWGIIIENWKRKWIQLNT